MNAYKHWLFRVVASTTIGVALVAGVNCIVDPYGILRRDFSKQFQEPNLNFIKTEYLLNGRAPFDSFLFGSSRVNFIDTAKIPKGTYYNYWYSEGVPAEHLANLKLLIERGIPIKNLAVALDDFSYLVDPEAHRTNLLRKPHPLTMGKSYPAFFSQYFLRLTKFFSNLWKYIRHNVMMQGKIRESGSSFDIYDSGRMMVPAWEEDIKNNPAAHVKNVKFLRPTHYEGNNLEDTLNDLREIKRLAERHGIALTVFINPIHRTTYLDTNLSQFFAFKRRLAEITDYYDFSGLNSVTTNNYYYYETSHYRPMIGDMMMKRMFGYPPVAVPDDFGVLVTHENVGEHLVRLREQIRMAAPGGDKSKGTAPRHAQGRSAGSSPGPRVDSEG